MTRDDQLRQVEGAARALWAFVRRLAPPAGSLPVYSRMARAAGIPFPVAIDPSDPESCALPGASAPAWETLARLLRDVNAPTLARLRKELGARLSGVVQGWAGAVERERAGGEAAAARALRVQAERLRLGDEGLQRERQAWSRIMAGEVADGRIRSTSTARADRDAAAAVLGYAGELVGSAASGMLRGLGLPLAVLAGLVAYSALRANR